MFTGQTLGRYQITAALGVGGMGEVYRATDTTLEREVAIKVLPRAVAANPDRFARFRREARVLASLNHPNIAAIYDFEEADGVSFLTLELVEGEDLAQRLRRAPIPLNEALEIAKQVAEALEAAHERGIIHRDLKPANIKVTPAGVAKVLDFGLAKAWAGDSGSGVGSVDPTMSPTYVGTETRAGVVLGTAAYMSPEPARGRVVDRRTDVWAFGVVLFEMLAGRRLFIGETETDVIAAVVTADPDWSALPAETPAAVRRLLRRCLQKDPRVRLPDMGAARVELSEVLSGVLDEDEGPRRAVARGKPKPPSRAAWVLVPLAVLVAAAVAFIAGRQLSGRRTAMPVTRVTLEIPADVRLATFTPPLISPDGRLVGIAATARGRPPMLWVRRIDALSFQPVPGTEGAQDAFWSPDSRHLGFLVNGVLKRVDLEGGVQTLSRLDSVFWGGGTWNQDGTIVLSKAPRGETDATAATLVRLAATGGRPEPLTSIDADRQEQGHYWPRFLPDSRHIAFSIGSRNAANQGVFITSLDNPRQRERILPEWSTASFAVDHLLFVRGNTLLAQPFDLQTRAAGGEPYAVAEGVEFWTEAGVGLFSASRNGTVVYLPSRPRETELVWVDRRGARLGSVGSPRLYGQFALSPDEKHVAVELPDAAGNFDLWIVELSRGVPTRLTFDTANDRDPVWSPDGSRLIFTSPRRGSSALFAKSVTAVGAEALLLRAKDDLYPESVSPDGKTLVYVSSGAVNQGRVGWRWPIDGSAPPTPLVQTGFRVDEMQISPDGRLIAYASAESGQYEVYLERFGGGREKIRVSTNGGGQPKWRKDGRELFYVSEGKLTAVEVAVDPELRVGLPRALFELEEASEELDDYAPHADGQRFLVKQRIARPGAGAVHMVLNWARDTGRR